MGYRNRSIALVLTLTVGGIFPSPALALPTHCAVEHGTVSTEQPDPNSLHFHIDSDQAILSCHHFNVALAERVDFHFHYPTATSRFLSRVTGGQPSDIAGSLFSNGQLFLVNPAGIHFAPTANVQTAGLVASTLNIENADFLKGTLEFEKLVGPSPAAIVNEGKIATSSPGGLIALLGGAVLNKGLLVAELGTVALAAGERMTLSFDPKGQWAVTVEEPVSAMATDFQGQPLAYAIEQKGTISTPGGQVLIQAKAVPKLFDRLVNQEGLVEAKSILAREGKVELIGEGGSVEQNGTIRVDGTLEAPYGGKVFLKGTRIIQKGTISAHALRDGQAGTIEVVSLEETFLEDGSRTEATGLPQGARGGKVTLLGRLVGLFGNSRVDASGDLGGGTVLIGGDFQGKGPLPNAWRTFVGSGSSIRADALTHGDGGRVILWSDDLTLFGSQISARGGVNGGNGGLAEVSGKESLVFLGNVDLDAPYGNTGTLLLDPNNITIANGTGAANDNQLNEATGDRSILFAHTPNNMTISEQRLEGLTSNVILQAKNNLTINNLTSDGVLNFSNVGAGESVVFQAGENIRFQNSSNTLKTAGADIHLEADSPHSSSSGGDGSGTLTLGKLTSNGGAITLMGADFVVNNTIDAGSGNITVGQSQSGQSLRLGSVSGALLTDAELDRFSTTGTLTIGQATTQGTSGAGSGAVTRTAGAITLDDLTLNSKNVTLVSGSTINDDDDTGSALTTTGTLTLTSGGAIGNLGGSQGLNTDVGTLVVTSTGGNSVTLTNAGTSTLTLSSVLTGGAGDVLITQSLSNLLIGVISTTGSVTLTSTLGSINDDANDSTTDITAGSLTLTASSLGQGIGTSNGSLDTTITHLIVTAGSGGFNLSNTGDILDGNGPGMNLTASGHSSLSATGIIGTIADPLDISITGATLSVGPQSQISGVSGVFSGIVTPSGTLGLLNTPPGKLILNDQTIFDLPLSPGTLNAFFGELLSLLFAPENQRRLRTLAS